MMKNPSSESFLVNLVAGWGAAVIGVCSFWVFHTIWILDVPPVLTEGLLFHSLPAAAALAWAVTATRKCGRFRGGLRDGAVLGLLLWLTLVPYVIVGAVWGPWVMEPETFEQLIRQIWLPLPGAPLGAAIGWALTRRAMPTAAWGVAALTVDFFLGGGIAFNGIGGAMLGLFFWLLPTWVVAGLAMFWIASILRARPTSRAHPSIDQY